MIKSYLVKLTGYIFPASSFQFVRPYFDYGVTFGPMANDFEMQKIRVRQLLRSSIIAKEGYRQDVYKDSLGKLTVGIGHLVTIGDNLKLGDKISKERVEQLFSKDSATALNAAMSQARELTDNPSDEFVLALTHVNFQLGINWRAKFPNTWRLLTAENYQQAINNLQNSAWADQTPQRVAAFVNAIKQEFLT